MLSLSSLCKLFFVFYFPYVRPFPFSVPKPLMKRYTHYRLHSIVPTSRHSLSTPPHYPPTTSLRASILFAQEYAILSASLDDRPFVPPCTVIFTPAFPNDPRPRTTPPQGLRWGFRRWDDRDGEGHTILGGGDVARLLGI